MKFRSLKKIKDKMAALKFISEQGFLPSRESQDAAEVRLAKLVSYWTDKQHDRYDVWFVRDMKEALAQANERAGAA